MSKRKAPKKSRTTAPTADASTSTPTTRETRECIISVCLTPFRQDPFLPFTSKYVGHPAWAGTVWDSADLKDKEKPLVPVFLLSTGDDTIVGRNSVVNNLQKLALRDGYAKCEVRDYGHATVDSFITLFNGLLKDQVPAGL